MPRERVRIGDDHHDDRGHHPDPQPVLATDLSRTQFCSDGWLSCGHACTSRRTVRSSSRRFANWNFVELQAVIPEPGA